MNQIFCLMFPELALSALLILLLVIKIWDGIKDNSALFFLINAALLITFAAQLFITGMAGTLFSGMYVSSELIAFEKNILLFGTILISFQAQSWLKDHKHLIEFYLLLIATLMGMFYMISAGNILLFYLGLEFSTIPLAALCNFDLEKRRSSESAMKLILSSAFSSGILLFGISLLYGSTGTLNFSEMVMKLHADELQIMAFVFIFAGFAFKLSVVPFHLWTADVYEGSPIAVTSYLSVISKGAIAFAFAAVSYRLFSPLAGTWYHALFLASVITMTIGNLFAIRQFNLKRFLAFSSITQAGYILLGISGNSRMGTASVVYFILVYIFSNLGAFGVVSLVSAKTGKEEMDDYRGFHRSNPVLAWIFALSLFSLAGIPPTAGFFGKLFLFISGASRGNYVFITIAALNMVVSLYYYLKVVRIMFVDKNERPMEKIPVPLFAGIALLICVAGILFGGMYSSVFEYIFSLCN